MYAVELSTVTRKKTEAPVRERLSRETIADGAVALADAEGLDAVTIRRLASDQGVTPMALYWHFRDKERLIDGIVERLLADLVLPRRPETSSVPWHVQLREILDALLVVLRNHPAVAELVHTRILRSDPGLEITERTLGLLREAGFSAEQAAQLAIQALSTMVTLVASVPGKQVGEATDVQDQRLRAKRASLQALSPERYPYLLASADALTVCASEPEYIDLGLDLFIAGVRGVQPDLARK
jgi:AcrR family transcriptional regulator